MNSSNSIRIKKRKNNYSAEIVFIYFATFWITIFPKAGVRLDQIPINVSTISVFLLLIYVLLHARQNSYELKVITFVLFIGCWTILTFLRNDSFVFSLSTKFAAVFWFLISPILWVSASRFRLRSGVMNSKLILVGYSFVGIFGLCQFFFGLNFLRINGLTIARGDTYLTKNLSIFEGSNIISSKIPATYQSGNLWGQISAIILIWAFETGALKQVKNRLSRLFIVCILVASVLMSLSRTALVAMLIGVLILIFRERGRYTVYILLVLLIIFPFARNISGITSRFSLVNLGDSSGRTNQWNEAFQTFDFFDWIFGRTTDVSAGTAYSLEGILGLFTQVGFIGFLLLLVCWKQAKLFEWPALSCVVFICVLIDSTYISPPFLWIPAILVLFSNNSGQYSKTSRIATKKGAKNEKH